MSSMIIDSFAGGGGASTGIECALGRSPDVAINHNHAALALHAVNHPDTLHLNSNIWDVKPLEVTKGRKVGLLWASPDCKHFSKAKGGAPRDRNIRDLAWIVVDWAEQAKPDVICMENVEEFPTWGPIDNDGQPIKEFAGQTYELWVKRLRKAGYRCQSRELRACDYGAPTIRKRWFFIARRDGRPITWPKPTHGAPDSAAVKRGKLLPWRTAAECIDWSIPCPSIFDTAPEIMTKHGLRAVRPLAANTLARIARGMKRYVLDADQPFLVNLTHGARAESASEPFRTITGAHRGEKAVIAPSLVQSGYRERAGQQPRILDICAPLGTVVAGGIKHALIAPSLTRFNTGATGQDLRAPLATITANSWIKRPGGAAPLGIIAPVLTYAQHGGAVRSVADPAHTITASKKDQNAVILPHLLSLKGSARRDFPATAPHPTVLAGGGHSALISAFLAQHHGGPRMGGNAGHDARDPISTIAASGSHQMPVTAWFAKYYGTGDGSRTDAPCHTVTVKDRFAHMQAALDAPPFTPEHAERARAVADFMRAHGAWDGGEFVTLSISGTEFVVVDIGMRMLTPRELFNAQGFAPDYVIEGHWHEVGGDWIWKPFPKDVQISCCGNSVCPDLAKAIVAANCSHLIAAERIAK
jgi:DNA (cytosine-5)-methyltransferase 1